MFLKVNAHICVQLILHLLIMMLTCMEMVSMFVALSVFINFSVHSFLFETCQKVISATIFFKLSFFFLFR